MESDLFGMPFWINRIMFVFRAARIGWTKRQAIRCWWIGVKYRSTDIRVSCAHLIRIRVGNKYLLVPSSRIQAQMQPPGGVVKVRDAGRVFIDRIGAHSGSDYETGRKDDDDLRCYFQGRHLLRFLTWYFTGKGREISPEREFAEELLDTKILPAELFSDVKLSKYKTKISGPHYSKYFDCTEVLVHEFFDLEGLSGDQARFLDNLSGKATPSREVGQDAAFGFYTSTEIAAGGRIPDAGPTWKVGEHTQWMVEAEEN